MSGLSRGTVCVGHRASASPPARTDLPGPRERPDTLRWEAGPGEAAASTCVSATVPRGRHRRATEHKVTRTNRTDGKGSLNAMQSSVSSEPGSSPAGPKLQRSAATFRAASQILRQLLETSLTRFFQNVSYRMQRPTCPNSQPAPQSRCPGFLPASVAAPGIMPTASPALEPCRPNRLRQLREKLRPEPRSGKECYSRPRPLPPVSSSPPSGYQEAQHSAFHSGGRSSVRVWDLPL